MPAWAYSLPAAVGIVPRATTWTEKCADFPSAGIASGVLCQLCRHPRLEFGGVTVVRSEHITCFFAFCAAPPPTSTTRCILCSSLLQPLSFLFGRCKRIAATIYYSAHIIPRDSYARPTVWGIKVPPGEGGACYAFSAILSLLAGTVHFPS